MNQQEALFEYLLRLGDNNLILGHRLSEWCGHGPILEEDIALINISLDLLGQANSLLKYAGEVEGKGRDQDDLAYLRTDREYRNALLCEIPNGDFGQTIVRQYLYDVYNFYFYMALRESKDEQLVAIAEKSLKEVAYHKKHSGDWVLRLGDGTEESHERIQEALDRCWEYTGDLFLTDEVDDILQEAGIVPDLSLIEQKWNEEVSAHLKEATLTIPEGDWRNTGGKKGMHTEHLGFILAELQYVQRAYPGNTW